MDRPRISINAKVLDDARKLVSELLTRVSAALLVPDWMHSLRVDVEAGKRKERGEALARFPYGDGIVTVKAGLLLEPHEEQDLIFLHEMAHLPLEPLRNYAMGLVLQFVKDDDVQTIIAKELQDKFERATEDVGLAYARLLGKDV